jgi:uncharacterized protein (DUF2235 family)
MNKESPVLIKLCTSMIKQIRKLQSPNCCRCQKKLNYYLVKMVEAPGYLLIENDNISVVVSARAVFTDLTLITVDFLIKESRPVDLGLQI